MSHRNENLAQSGRKRRGGEEQCHDKGLHAGWRSSVGQLIGGNVAETFGNGTESNVGDLQPNAERAHTGADSAASGVVTARAGLINLPLNQGAAHTADRRQNEAKRDTVDATEDNPALAQERIDDVGKDGDRDDDRERVEVGLWVGRSVTQCQIMHVIGGYKD